MNEAMGSATARRRSPRPIRRTRVIVYGALLSGVIVAVFSGDFVCSAIGAAFLGGLIVAAAVVPICWLLRPHPRSLRISLALVVVATAFAQAAYIHGVLRQTAFRDAFGVDLPGDVYDVQCTRYYAGGPGDTVTLLRFQADPRVITRLVGARSLTETPESIFSEFQEGRASWIQVWNNAFSLASDKGCPWWPDAPPMKRPMHFTHSREAPPGPFQSVKMLWDAETGIAYVLITFG